jgi:hypothetical protein
MGLIGSFVRFMVSIVIFVAALVFGIILSVQHPDWFTNLPGTLTFTSGATTVAVPLLASIVLSVGLSLVMNLVTLPLRRAG